MALHTPNAIAVENIRVGYPIPGSARVGGLGDSHGHDEITAVGTWTIDGEKVTRYKVQLVGTSWTQWEWFYRTGDGYTIVPGEGTYHVVGPDDQIIGERGDDLAYSLRDALYRIECDRPIDWGWTPDNGGESTSIAHLGIWVGLGDDGYLYSITNRRTDTTWTHLGEYPTIDDAKSAAITEVLTGTGKDPRS